MAEIVFTEEDRAFVAKALEDLDPERHPVIRSVTSKWHDNLRDEVLDYMRRKIQVEVEVGMVMRAIARNLEERQLAWVDVNKFSTEAILNEMTEFRGAGHFNIIIEHVDESLDYAFAALLGAAEARGLLDHEHEARALKNEGLDMELSSS